MAIKRNKRTLVVTPEPDAEWKEILRGITLTDVPIKYLESVTYVIGRKKQVLNIPRMCQDYGPEVTAKFIQKEILENKHCKNVDFKLALEKIKKVVNGKTEKFFSRLNQR